jgi:hypothetical protein
MALLAAAMCFEGESASANVGRMLVVAVAGTVRRPGSLILEKKTPFMSFSLVTNALKVNGQPLTIISSKDKESEFCLKKL